MSFTPTKIVHECWGCEREFIVSEEAITEWLDDGYATTREDAIESVDWCLECITGKPHPEECPRCSAIAEERPERARV